MHAFVRLEKPTPSRDKARTMGAVEDAKAFLRPSDDCKIAAVIRKYDVSWSNLSKQFRGKTGSVARRIEGWISLTNKREEESVRQIEASRVVLPSHTNNSAHAGAHDNLLHQQWCAARPL